MVEIVGLDRGLDGGQGDGAVGLVRQGAGSIPAPPRRLLHTERYGPCARPGIRPRDRNGPSARPGSTAFRWERTAPPFCQGVPPPSPPACGWSGNPRRPHRPPRPKPSPPASPHPAASPCPSGNRPGPSCPRSFRRARSWPEGAGKPPQRKSASRPAALDPMPAPDAEGPKRGGDPASARLTIKYACFLPAGRLPDPFPGCRKSCVILKEVARTVACRIHFPRPAVKDRVVRAACPRAARACHPRPCPLSCRAARRGRGRHRRRTAWRQASGPPAARQGLFRSASGGLPG